MTTPVLPRRRFVSALSTGTLSAAALTLLAGRDAGARWRTPPAMCAS